MVRRACHSLAALLALVCVAAAALTFPPLSGRVVDEAGILDAATRAELTQKLADLEARSTDQLVVVTLRSLQGTSIEDCGYQLGRAWGIGQQGKNNGVLLIVAPNERKVRIEVGYGLEGTLTDAIASFIVQTSILPRFKANDYPGGIRRGVEDIIQVLTGDAEEYRQRAARTSPRTDSPDDLFLTIVIVIFILVMLWNVYRSIQSRDMTPNRRGSGWSVPSGGGSWSSGSSGGGGFSGGGGSFGGGGSSGSW
ncbi:MAG: TPM domain-containing protein [Pseudorhodoplanes sp.]|nr:TPM domain-containing protein [Pseudorhodoplanes sp.]